MLLLKNICIVEANSPHHNQRLDMMLNSEGIIERIGRNLHHNSSNTIDCEGYYASVGWFDFGVHVCDPGYEHREDLTSAMTAAVAGGFTAIAPYPNTMPVVDCKASVSYLLRRANDRLPIHVFPIGAISHNCLGKELAEMYDMHHSGAIAFSDGANALQNAGLLLRALEYVKAINSLVVNRPQQKDLAPDAQMNEGIVSTFLGVRGVPHLAEELMVQRDIELAKYANSRLHLADLSCAKSVALVRQAKAEGLAISASVGIMNLVFDDNAIHDFDTNFKLMPPLRTQHDRHALITGIIDGTIDFISSGHTPWDDDAKKVEFLYAEFGALGLQTLLPLYATFLGDALPLETFTQAVSIGARRVLGLPIPTIAEGELANLVIFNPAERWFFTKELLHSKSHNTPLLGSEVFGRVKGTILGKSSFWN